MPITNFYFWKMLSVFKIFVNKVIRKLLRMQYNLYEMWIHLMSLQFYSCVNSTEISDICPGKTPAPSLESLSSSSHDHLMVHCVWHHCDHMILVLYRYKSMRSSLVPYFQLINNYSYKKLLLNWRVHYNYLIFMVEGLGCHVSRLIDT